VRKGKGVPDKHRGELSQKIPEWYFNYLDKIQYMFPKAHAAAYMIISSKQAWYKSNFNGEFYAAYLSVNSGYIDANWFFYSQKQLIDLGERYKKEAMDHSSPNFVAKKKKYSAIKMVLECLAIGYSFESPNVNFSAISDFVFSDGKIFNPLLTVPGAGPTLCEKVVSERQSGGLYKDMIDLYMRVKPKEEFLFSLNNYGNFDVWDEEKKEICIIKRKEYEKIEKQKQFLKSHIDSGQRIWNGFLQKFQNI
jgi:DNA polymerase-3 subunit alpha (Gram-positive type)